MWEKDRAKMSPINIQDQMRKVVHTFMENHRWEPNPITLDAYATADREKGGYFVVVTTNIDDLMVSQLLLYIVAKNTSLTQGLKLKLSYTYVDPRGEHLIPLEEAVPINGVVGTRRGSWSQFIAGSTSQGEWTLEFSNPFEQLFKDEAIEDILFVITYNGSTPDWPK